jgi:predicted acyl esterase
MKKKSNANLAFISLRVLAGFLAAAVIVFALAVSSRMSSANPLDLDTPCATPTCTPSPPITFSTWTTDNTEIKTDLYATIPLTAKPVLVMRGVPGCIPANIWSPSSAYHLLVQESLAASDSSPVPFNADRVDGQALLGWLAAQPWCNGRISMEGWSANAIVDYLAVPGATTALVGIQANFATGDLLNYGFFNGGVLHRETADLLGYSEGTPWEDYASLPVWSTNYLITQHDASLAHAAGIERSGWFDVFCQGTLDSFSRLQTQGGSGAYGKQKLVIGPWGHGVGNGTVGELQLPAATDPNYPPSTYDTAWQDAMFQNQWTAWNNLPPVRVYVINKNPPWTTYNTWPPPGYEYPLYFNHNGRPGPGNGSLKSDNPPPAAGSVSFTSNPSSPCPTLGGTNNLISCVPCVRPDGTCGSYDQRPIESHDRSDALVFTGGLGGGGMVGRIHADVWIQTTLPDVDVFVRMTDVYPDGKSMLMAQGIQRARYRNGVCPQPLPSNTPTLVRVDLGSTALVLPADHRLRVIVSAAAGPSNGGVSTYPLYSINPQNGDEYVGTHPNSNGTINVLFGGTYASALYIPVLTGTNPPPDRRPNTTPCPN